MTGPRTAWRPCRPLGVALLLLAVAGSGCAELTYYNTVGVVDQAPKTRDESIASQGLKACYFYPVRDAFEPIWADQSAWNVDPSGEVPTGSFYVKRDVSELTPEQIRMGPCSQAVPRQPFTVTKLRKRGPRPTFFGTDADGRRFLFKLDHRDWPELASGAEVIATRLVWAMGYHVPDNYLVTVEGTGNPDLDGRRAVASELIPGKVAGHWKLDWLRYRREMRALQLVSAWVNDVDRVANNCLVTVVDGTAVYYLLDFDSALGSWQGRPKPPWRSKRYWWDTEWQLRQVLTLGLADLGYDPNQPIVSTAVGRFDADFEPMAWRAQLPNAAFDKLDAADAAWMAGKLAALTREQIQAAVAAAELSDPADSTYIVETLVTRRDAIVQKWAAGRLDGR